MGSEMCIRDSAHGKTAEARTDTRPIVGAKPRPYTPSRSWLHLGRTSALPLSVALVEASRQPLHDSSTRGQVVVDVVGTTLACVVAHHVYSLFSSAEESAPS